MAVDVKLLARMTEVHGVPGHEHEILELLGSEFRKLGYKVETDRIGNLIARSPASLKAKDAPVMVGAHMDEIGMLVKFINDKGFIRFMKIGGIDNRVLLNQRVVVLAEKENIYGVIGSKPPHLLKPEEAKVATELKQMFIDIGAKDKKDAEKMGVKIGDPVVFDIPMKVLNKKYATGKALDNRAGCYAMLEAARRLKSENVVFVGTAQEEVSTFGKGAMLSAYALKPRAFIAVDTSIAGDHPEMAEDEGAVKLDEGPALALVEAGGRGNVADKKLTADIIAVAKKAKIPYQIEVIEGGATDAASVYGVRAGIPSIAVCVPTRYIHSNVAVCSLDDIEKTVELVVKCVQAKVG